MSAVANAAAPANAAPSEPFATWDRSPVLSASEHAALDVLGARFADHQRQWPAGPRAALARLLSPVYTLLDQVRATRAPRNSVVHIVVVETQRRGLAY